MADWSDEETDEPLLTNHRNFERPGGQLEHKSQRRHR
jgi:hypothetical protein